VGVGRIPTGELAAFIQPLEVDWFCACYYLNLRGRVRQSWNKIVIIIIRLALRSAAQKLIRK
jgi:hypothetical protein